MYQYFFHSMLTDKNYRITADFTFDTFCSDKTTYFVNLFANTPKHNISIRCKIKIGHQWKNEIISTNDWMLSGVLWKMLASKHMQCRVWHRLLQMNCLTAIYKAERFNNKCMKVALLIDLTDRPSRYVQSAFALHQLFIFNVAMQFIPVNKDVCLIYYM